MSKSDIDEALRVVQNIKRVGKVIAEAAPWLNELEEGLVFFKSADSLTPPYDTKYQSMASDWAKSICEMDLESISDEIMLSGIGGGLSAMNSASGSMRHDVLEAPANETASLAQFQSTLFELKLKKDNNREIGKFLNKLAPYVSVLFDDALLAHDKWKNEIDSLKTFGLAMRTLIEKFKGELNKLRVEKSLRPNGKIPGFSWNKMAREIKREGPGVEKALLLQKPIHENLHNDMSEFLKDGILRGKKLSTKDIESYWLDVKDHIWSISLLLDQTLL